MTADLTLRRAGVLLHPTSLPGPHGVGDLGPDAYRFVDWLAAAGQRVWQIPDAFEYIAKFFRDSISELGTRNRKIEIRFSRVNSRSFEVAVKVVRDDEKPIDICYRIWTAGTEIMMGEKPTRALEMTVSLAVARAPYSSVPAAKDILLAKWRLSADRNRDGLHLSAHARGWLGFRNERQQLSMHGGAEYLWQVFTKLVQNPKSV